MHQAFTLKSHNGRLDAIVTNCGVSLPYDPKNGGRHPEISKFNALWDTGATGSVITSNIVKKLGLKPIGKAKSFHADGESIVNVYFINIFLPNNVGLSTIRVTEGKLKGFDVLIGMDIITLGDFSITNKDAKTWVSFQIPSSHEIDYVANQNNENIELIPTNTANVQEVKNPYIGASRNLPCPCGSGKKFKHCHGK